MAEGKLNLADDLISSKSPDERFSVKGEAWVGKGEDKALTGLLDEAKDQVTSESSIPLSPQWLYAKPVDSKMLGSGTSGDTRSPNALAPGNLSDSNSKDSWHLDGSQEKKDWKKASAEVGSGRRWREEERETGQLGRNRKKDDHRVDAMSARDNSEKRVMSSDRWHDIANRNSGHEFRRDGKWSSRWGPEEKEKDIRTEKRTDAEKEDNDKQSFVSNNRAAPERENDSRDKWRPRHLMEVHVVGSAAYRTAPGFGLERGRVEGSNMRFAPGRGRATGNGSVQIGRPPCAPGIGSLLSFKNNKYCYPRGKLLDNYRNQKSAPNFHAIPEGMEHLSPPTQVDPIKPLAFVVPNIEEESALGEIWSGKITSSGVFRELYRDKYKISNDNVTGINDASLAEEKRAEEKQISLTDAEETVNSSEKAGVKRFCKGDVEDSHVSGIQILMAEEKDAYKGEQKILAAVSVAANDVSNNTGESGPGNSAHELALSTRKKTIDMDFWANSKLADIDAPTSFEIGSQLPDDSNSLFDFSSLRQNLSDDSLRLKSSDEGPSLESGIPPEELSLYYLDPQGNVQGPYLGIDIITWFEQGYFGTDLPVRLSDAPEQFSFQELGQLMPHLKIKSTSASSADLLTRPTLSDVVGGSLEESVLVPASASDIKGLDYRENQHWSSSGFDVMSSFSDQSRVPDHNYHTDVQYDQSFKSFVAQDEEIVFPVSSTGIPFMGPDNRHRTVSNTTGPPSLVTKFSDTSLPQHEDDRLHPFGLPLSELRSNSHLRGGQSSNIITGVGEHDHRRDAFFEKDTGFTSHRSFGAMADQIPLLGTQFSDYRNEQFSGPNINSGPIDAHHVSHWEQEFNDFDLAKHLMAQKLQNEQLQPHDLSSSHPFAQVSGLEADQIQGFTPSKLPNLQSSVHKPFPNIDQVLELQFQQRRQLELQQQQRQFELQQQRQFELQQQQRLMLMQQKQQEQQKQLRDHQIKLLQQQQQQQHQSQVQQLPFEQMRQHLMSDLGYGQPNMDPVQDNFLEQSQLRMLLLRELQQNPHTSRHFDPSLEQILQAEISQNALREQEAHYLDLLSQVKHGEMHPSDHELYLRQQQFEVQQLSMALRQQLGMEGERHVGRPWAVDETGQFQRDPAGSHHSFSAGINTSDFYQQQQRLPSHEEQLGHLNRGHILQEHHQRGFYEPNSQAFERSISIPTVNSAMKLDSANASAQGLDLGHLYMHSADQLSSFTSGASAVGREVLDDFHGSHPQAMAMDRSGNNRQLNNSSIEGRIQQLHLEAERQRKFPDSTIISPDLDMWGLAGTHEENTKQALLDLHQGLGVQSMQSSEVYTENRISSSDTGEILKPISKSFSSSGPFNRFPGHLVSEAMNRQFNHQGNSEGLPLRLNSAALSEESFLTGDSDMTGRGIVERDGNERKNGSQGITAMSRSFLERGNDLVVEAEGSMDFQELPINAHSRHSSLSSAGGNGSLYSYDMGLDKSVEEEVFSYRQSSILNKGLASHRRPPVSRALSSQDVSSQLDSSQLMKLKNSTNIATSDGVNCESTGNSLAVQNAPTLASGHREVNFRRTSSCSDAVGSETFIEMLKKPAPSEADAISAAAMDSSDGVAGPVAGKSVKKKGKKGRQIDPALLGFKVSSNRILMGEIQRLED